MKKPIKLLVGMLVLATAGIAYAGSKTKVVVNGVSAEGAILRHIWIPCVLTGFANPGANLHAPDENIHVDKYLQGIKYAAAIMEHFGQT